MGWTRGVNAPLAGLAVLAMVAIGIPGCPAEEEPDDDTIADDDDDSVGATDLDGDGWTVDDGDCNDDDPTVHPGAEEIPYDTIDQDCDGADLTDVDGDGCGVLDGDCDDDDPTVHPDAEEIPYDGIDQDCDGADLTDVDGDGYDGYEVGGGDCDDDKPDVHPNAEETCDGVDADCDGQLELWGESDADGDGWVYCQGDCDDLDASLTPADADGDSYSTCQGDCDDADASVNPSVAEIADGLDNDCDGTVDEGIIVCTITVPTDHTTIQAAIDASENGDVVCVNAGTYVENIDFTGKAIEVRGVDGRALTVIDGDAAGPVVTIASSEGADSILHGLTLTGGRATNGGGLFIDGASPTVSAVAIDDNSSDNNGGGAYVYSSGVSMNDVSVTDNSALDGGGGLYVRESAGALFTGLTVDYNTADDTGGGIHIRSGSSIGVFDLVVSSNVARHDGAGIYIDGESMTIDLSDAVIFGNTTLWSNGGGIYKEGETDLYASDLVVMGNRARQIGAGIHIRNPGQQFSGLVVANNTSFGYEGAAGMDGIYADETTITDALFIANHATNSPGGGLGLWDSDYVEMNNVAFIQNEANKGGGLFANGSGHSVTNGLFVANSGGGLYLDHCGMTLVNTSILGNYSDDYPAGGIYAESSSATVENSIFAGNSSTGTGGIYVHSILIVTNTVVVDNQGAYYGGGVQGHHSGTYIFSNNDVYSNSPDDYHDIDDPTGTDGNISVDPLFLDLSSPDPLDWDLHLDLSSALIDAGDPTILDPDGSPSDIGAFGGPNAATWDLDQDGFPSWWQPGPYDSATYPDEGWDCDDLDPTVHPGAGC